MRDIAESEYLILDYLLTMKLLLLDKDELHFELEIQCLQRIIYSDEVITLMLDLDEYGFMELIKQLLEIFKLT